MEEVERMAGQREGKAVFGLPSSLAAVGEERREKKIKEKERKGGVYIRGLFR